MRWNGYGFTGPVRDMTSPDREMAGREAELGDWVLPDALGRQTVIELVQDDLPTRLACAVHPGLP